MPQRVLINCKWEAHTRVSGVQRYSADLIGALSGAGLDFDRASPGGRGVLSINLWEQLRLPWLARKYHILVCPANMAPAALPGRVRLILTIHCLRFLMHPENYSGFFALWYRFMIPWLIRRARVILTVSEHEAREIASRYPASKGKIEVVPPAASALFNPDGPAGDRAIGHDRYWVFIGNAAPAKNLRVLLEALEQCQGRHRLVLLGVSREQLAARGSARLSQCVQALGQVNDARRVASILRGGQGLLAPSVYESFDLPILEAMSCGCPVIASDIPIHREVAGPAPVYADPSDPAGWALAMDRLAQDASLRERHRGLGLVQAERYSWDRSAARLREIIEQVREPRP